MIVVADTGPINYLICIDQIAVLPKLYTRVLIPEAVREELQKAAAPDPVRQWITSPPEWLEIRRPTRAPDIELMQARIGPGEREAILLAEESGADALIVDDMRDVKKPSAAGYMLSARWWYFSWHQEGDFSIYMKLLTGSTPPASISRRN